MLSRVAAPEEAQLERQLRPRSFEEYVGQEQAVKSLRISVEAALRHFTVDSAYASFEEHRKGTLAAGRLADLVVLSDDILSIPPARIFQTRVLLTVMGGRDTYRAPEL